MARRIGLGGVRARASINFKRFDRKMQRLGGPGQVLGPLAGKLHAEAVRIMDISRPLVPLDTGKLRDSGVVFTPRIGTSDVSVQMQYGGSAAPYAAIQHERLDFHHPTPGTQAKYLEEPVVQERPRVIANLRGEVVRVIRRLTR